MTYNPFNKSINDPLDETDLLELINKKVAEGYYIEYKGSIFPNPNKISHSIASFANSYGGWYFVGIETDAANVANNIVGFDLNSYKNPIAKVREVVKDHIDPIPRFYVQQINLGQPDKAVIVVYVPPEQDTPFITKDGRIYRRTHDSSNPIPEANRHTIDRLIEEGRKTKDKFAKFCKDDRTFSKSESENKNIGWLNIFIKPYSYDLINCVDWSKETLRKTLQKSKDIFEIPTIYTGLPLSGNLPFTSIYPTQKSIILKQINPYYSAFQGLTVEFYFDGRAKFHIPINYFNLNLFSNNFNKQEYSRNHITSLETIDLFEEIKERNDGEAGFQYLRFFNAGEISVVILTLSTFYLNWLKYDDGLITDLKISAEFKGAWRAVPYFDDDEWAKYVKEFGFPIGNSDIVVFPENISEGFKFETSEKNLLGGNLTELIGLMFGFPTENQHLALAHYLKKYATEQKQTE